MREARNLRHMTTTQTPLLGDANVPLEERAGPISAMPSRTPTQTPNPLLTPAHGRGADPAATPLRALGTSRSDIGRTPLRTPQRDDLGLNADDGRSSVGGTPRQAKLQMAAARNHLKLGLQSLPAPKNDFEIVVDDDHADEAPNVDQTEDADKAEDATIRNARIAKLKEEERIRELARRSQAVQLELPRPRNFDLDAVLRMFASLPPPSDVEDRTQRLVDDEMVKLMHHDAVEHPLPGSKVAGYVRSTLPTIPDAALATARELMHNELASTLGFPGAAPEALKRLTGAALEDDEEGLRAFEEALRSNEDSFAWNSKKGTWVDRAELSEVDIVQGCSDILEKRQAAMADLASVAAKGEKTLAKLLGGYQARSKALGAKIRETFADLEQGMVERRTFERLLSEERTGLVERMEKLQAEVGRLERQHGIAQRNYASLDSERAALREECEALQAELDMRAAEAENEKALES